MQNRLANNPAETNLNEVLDILFARKWAGSTPGDRSDSKHVALVIEGGGMRGVAGGAMVTALEKAGLRDSFDSVHGSSAGAAAGAYFVACQAEFGTRIYYEDLTGPEFISPRRALFGKPILDTSYLVENVMHKIKRIDYTKILERKLPLHIVMTDIDTAEIVEVSRFEDEAHYRQCLMASLSLPFVSGPNRVVGGARVLDGGLVAQVPIASAVRAGATHLLVIQTSRVGEGIRKTSTLSLRAHALFLQAYHGGQMRKLYLNRNRLINQDVMTLRTGNVGKDCKALSVQIPAGAERVGRMTKDRSRLKKFADACEENMAAILGSFEGCNYKPRSSQQRRKNPA
jgi:predicted patatin/cPLA2 family phospholipase